MLASEFRICIRFSCCRNIFYDYGSLRKSAKLDEENGTAMNQQGLLLQDAYPPRALLYFLLANNAPVPFHGAYSNVLNLLKQQNEQHKQQEGDITLKIVEHCFINFRSVLFLNGVMCDDSEDWRSSFGTARIFS